jgi:aminoglycoside/choline kinase family phosphotransferase
VPTADSRLRPACPVAEMVTWEIAEYRRSLEEALALEVLPSWYLPREMLRKQLDAVLAEEAEREAIRHAKPAPADA